MGAVDEILDWSTHKLTPWRQDALRRLASSSAVTAKDESELLALIKEKAGFPLASKPPSPVPLSKAHLAPVTSGSPLQIKGIRNVKNVNRLVPAASLTFVPNGLTVIYGRNGSGKSGFVRIFRTACRTRTDNPAKLKVLADVYGSGGGPQEAEIIVDRALAMSSFPGQRCARLGGPFAGRRLRQQRSSTLCRQWQPYSVSSLRPRAAPQAQRALPR